MTYIMRGTKKKSIGSDDDFSPGRRPAITWDNGGQEETSVKF